MNASPIAPTTSLHLQYVGQQQALLTEELFVGAVTVWNTGALEIVTHVEQVSKCFYAVTTRSLEYDRTTKTFRFKAPSVSWSNEGFTCRMKVGRAVGYSQKATALAAALVSV